MTFAEATEAIHTQFHLPGTQRGDAAYLAGALHRFADRATSGRVGGISRGLCRPARGGRC